MKKGLITGFFVAGVCAGVCIAGMWYTQQGYEEAVNRQIADFSAKDTSGMILSRTPISSSFFSLSDEYSLAIPPESQIALGFPVSADMQTITVNIANNCVVFPFVLSCDNDIRFTGSDALTSFTQSLTNVEYDASWRLNVLSQSISSVLNTKPYTFDDGDTVITVNAIDVSASTDLEFTEMVMNVAINGMEASSEGVTISTGKMAMFADLDDLKKNSWIGENEFTVDSLNVTGLDGQAMSAKDLSVKSVTQEYEKDKFDVVYNVKLASYSIVDDLVSISADNFNFDMRGYGISAAALELMQDLQAQNMQDTAAIEELVDELGKNEPGLSLNDLSVNVNGAPVSSSGEISMQPFTYGDVETLAIARKVNASFSAEIGSEVQTGLPQLIPVIEQYVQMGLISQQENGAYRADIKMENGTLTVNDTVMSQF